MEGMIIYMLDDVEYPLPKTTLQKMLDHKCEVPRLTTFHVIKDKDTLRFKTRIVHVLECFLCISLLFRRYGLSLILYRAPCAIKGVLSTPGRPRESSKREKHSAKKKGRMWFITTEDHAEKRNDVKAEHFVVGFPDEIDKSQQYDQPPPPPLMPKTWEAILKNFWWEMMPPKDKKNQLKQQFGKLQPEGRYGLGLILYRAPCAIKGVLRIRVLERDLELRDNKIENLRNELEEVKKEKESIDFKIEKFDNASKDLDSLLGNKRLDKDKKGLGFNEYSVVPPPPAKVYSPPKKDLSWMGLPKFVDDTVTDYSRPTPSIDVSKDVSDEQKAIWKSNSASFSEQGGSVGNVVSKPMIRFVKETGCPSVSKVNNTKKSRKPTVKYAEMYRSQRPRGNQRN
ncbi:hypothetical protein Tco_0700178 [Tanacetum coccineum]